MNELTVEVFAVGVWNGMKFTSADLNVIADSFRKLSEVHRVPLKFGHNDEQPFTDGQPALGWVSDVWVEKGKDGGLKLFAKFNEMPELVFKSIDKGRYKNVSIELDFDVSHNGTVYSMVLSGVALLGADLPAVNTIADLKTYMSKDEDALEIKFSRRQFFTHTHEVQNMDELEKLKQELADANRANAALTSEKSKLEGDKANFERDEKARIEKERFNRINDNRTKVNALFDKAVTDMRITPAKRELFSKILGVDDDDKVLNITIKDVEQMCEGEPMNQSASFSKKDDDLPSGMDVGDFLSNEAMKFSAEKDMPYGKALEYVYRVHPDKARDHINATVEV